MSMESAVLDSSSVDFPLRVAVVDIGSNAIRFTAAEFLSPASRQDIESHRVPVRLGHSAFKTGRLTEENMDAAVAAMAGFRRKIDTFGVRDYRAVATSAVRESRNGGDLVDRVRQEAGIRIETITGSEEARLVWLAVRDRISLEGRWMLMDLGGGSLEISVIDGGTFEWSESHTMGTVRLLENLGGNTDTPAAQRKLQRLLEEYTATLRVSVPADLPLVGLVATGGNIEALADLAGVERDASGVSVLRVAELEALNDRLAELTFEQRMERLDLRPDRADVIVPAGLLYLRVADLAGVDVIHVPRVGVADGAFLDLVAELTSGRLHLDRQEQEVYGAALAVGRKFNFDEAHGRHVAGLALSLFDQLSDLHALDTNDRMILLAAALLHDVGQFVSYRKHHKHSLYLIQNSEMAVFSLEEIALVGLVARYHRRAHPKEHHFVWSDLDSDQRSRVARLAALLRVADALDREHLQTISWVDARVGAEAAGALDLRVEGTGDNLLEEWALEKKGVPFFEEVFGLRPRLRRSEGEQGGE